MAKKERVAGFIVEDHNEVVEHLHGLMGRKRLPLAGLTMIHFDSHPDLLIPTSMLADTAFDRYGLQDALSIENWLLPLCYAGHISNVIWVRPEWSNQIQDGIYAFHIGKHSLTGTIRISCKEMYFVSELLYVPLEELEDSKEVTLLVLSLKDLQESVTEKIQELLNEGSGYILDVDLDYFSTRNPFLSLYPEANLYSRLERIYYYESSKDASQEDLNLTLARRREQIDELKQFFNTLNEVKTAEPFTEEILLMNTALVKDETRRNSLVDLVQSVSRAYPGGDIDWGLIHDAGCTADETGLPHHVSTREEIVAELIPQFESFLKLFARKPNVITISRSSEDDYCPKDDVEFIQESVLFVLQGLFSNLNITKAYLNDRE